MRGTLSGANSAQGSAKGIQKHYFFGARSMHSANLRKVGGSVMLAVPPHCWICCTWKPAQPGSDRGML